MADIDKTGAVCVPAAGLRKHFTLVNEIDFSESGNALANGKTMALFDVPAGVLVEEVMMYVSDADAQVSDVDVGIEGAQTDGFIDGGDPSATGYKRDVAGESYSPPTGYIAATDAVVLLTNNDADTLNDAVIKFIAKCVDCNSEDF